MNKHICNECNHIYFDYQKIPDCKKCFDYHDFMNNCPNCNITYSICNDFYCFYCVYAMIEYGELVYCISCNDMKFADHLYHDLLNEKETLEKFINLHPEFLFFINNFNL